MVVPWCVQAFAKAKKSPALVLATIISPEMRALPLVARSEKFLSAMFKVKSIFPTPRELFPVNPLVIAVPPPVGGVTGGGVTAGAGSLAFEHPDRQFCKITAPILIPTKFKNYLRSILQRFFVDKV